MLQKLDNFFGITRLGSNFRIEIFAGLSTFLSLSYIFVVNPAILSAAGISTSAIFFATVVGSDATTLLMGLWARLPFAGFVEKMGYKGILAEGADHILGWRSPNFLYRPKGSEKIKLLLKNYRLSDDIAFRFSEKGWKEYPL